MQEPRPLNSRALFSKQSLNIGLRAAMPFPARIVPVVGFELVEQSNLFLHRWSPWS